MVQHSSTIKDTLTPDETATIIQQSPLVLRSPVYYGWIILLAGVVGRIMTSPGQTYSVSIFIEHFISDLGVSRSLVSTLYTVGTLLASFTLPFVGRQIDKRGPRTMVVVITAFFTLACVYMSFVQNALMLGVGFVLIRMLGQGSLGMVSSNVINRWWVRRRGAVMGVAGVLAALLGSGAFPSLVHALIGRFDWRSSYALLGLLMAVVMLPVGAIFFRRQPEDYGLLPDGARSSSAERLSSVEENWTRAEALHTSAFWIISLTLACAAMLNTGLQFHMVSIFEDVNLSASAAAMVFMPVALAGAIVRIVGGVLIDRIPARFLVSGAMITLSTSLVMAPRLHDTTTALVYGVVLGITVGLELTVGTVIWAKYFGRQHLGSITGIASLVMIAGSALGPMPMGIARDIFGSYNLALTAVAVLPLTLAVVVLFVRRPQKASHA